MHERTYSLIDSHCHLNDRAFEEDRDEVVSRAQEQGIEYILDVATTPEDWERSLALAERYECVRCVLGIHPNSASLWSSEVRDGLLQRLMELPVVGIGETGYDFYRMGATREEQFAAFDVQLDIARLTQMPVVIHSRNSYDEVLDLIASQPGPTYGVMHSFAGTVEQAMRAMELGYYISLSGPVTYRNGQNLRELAASVPLDRLLVETDSPYLPPQPRRGERNEPSYVALTARAVADSRGIPFEELARATTENAKRVFRL